ncbi:hypothetical protein DPMN_027666 [Dreissena polymorpha]|uniref:Uncharacterized protein n=1 Tax=Dreissena polymorpha TaxID=45954 RepID=A0A9D4REK7_DREPO|nr:hypothetical protein DPMN_027666 [Dreissena polymorpha]
MKTAATLATITNLRTKFHEDSTIIVSSRVKTTPPTGSHIFQRTGTILKLSLAVVTRVKKTHLAAMSFLLIRTIFELNHYFQETNVLAKFHENWAKNVSSRLFPCFHFIHIEKTAPPPGGHTKFQDDEAKNVTSRENYPLTPWRPCFLPIQTIFELNHWTKNVTFRVFTCFHYIHIEKTAPPPGGHVFSPIWTIFELIREINKINVLTKFHDDWSKNVTYKLFTRNTAPPPWRPLHEDWASNVTSTVFTSIPFEFDQDIIGTNLLTKFHADQTINVATRVFTKQNVDDERRTTENR